MLLLTNVVAFCLCLVATKPRHLSEYKLGISIPARGESRDLLIAEGDKNDYDWYVFSLLMISCS